LAFLILYGVGFHFIARDVGRNARMTLIEKRVALNAITLAGLYAVNLLAMMSAVLLPVDTLSGEIASGSMQALAAKPVRRVEILLGKWLAYVLVVAGYIAGMAGGVLLVARAIGQFTTPGITGGNTLKHVVVSHLGLVSIAI